MHKYTKYAFSYVYTFPLQILSDFTEFLQSLKDGTSDFCCFANEDIVTESVTFDEIENPAYAARRLFVRTLHSYQWHYKN